MGISSGGRGSHGRAPLSEINVTPMVDIMLVLLVIFMVAAPMMTTGVPVDLPQVRAPQMDISQEKVLITVGASGELFIEDQPVELDMLETALRNHEQAQSDDQVYIYADENARYGSVMKIFAAIKRSGIEELGLVTDPLGSE
ncbi:MAG: biopolymer transporter ExbD [Myxococcota bacterium]